MPILPTIPDYITVHLGAPTENAPNVTVSFPNYIKNVASSEIYPTWPESALRANIYAQISYTLNRVYTEFYRNRGYNFQITNNTGIDQSFVYGRDIFDNISRIVDEIFNSYIRRRGSVEPLLAAYCDGVEVTCPGLSQWGSVTLAQDGLTPIEILKNYYGDDIELVTDVPVTGIPDTAPSSPLTLESTGPAVQLVQTRLNRISTNYPAIPKIYPTNGIFNLETQNAVRAFQEIFDLTPDGIVGQATWYRIQFIYYNVKRLAELNSEGLSLSEISTQYPSVLQEGVNSQGVRILQYYLSYIAKFVPTVSAVNVDGDFGPATRDSVISFQRTYGLTQDGIVGEATWNKIYNVYLGLISSLEFTYREGLVLPFPGSVITLGSEGEDVVLLQNYLNFIARTYTSLPTLPVTGYYGTQTEDAVRTFTRLFGLPDTGGTVTAPLWNSITRVYEDLYNGQVASEGQYPGYEIGGTP